MSELPSPLGRQRAAVAFILVTILLDIMALGMVIPVLPSLVIEFMGGDTVGAATVYGVFGTVWALMQFLCSPLLGALSDRFGRRPVILLSNLGLGLDYVLMALAPNLAWLFVGRVISGITAASIGTAGAYVADITPRAQRAGRFGLLGSAFGLGFVLGPAVGGLLGSYGPRLPFWVAAGFSLANALYGLLVLPDSLPPERRANFSWRRATPLGPLRLLRSQPGLLGLAGVSILYSLAHEVLPSTFVLYATYRYGWGEAMTGLTLAAVGVGAMIVQGWLIKPFVARIGERATLLFGLGCGAFGMAIYGLAPTGAWFWSGIPVMALWGLASPATQSLMSGRVGGDEQGQLQGALSALRGITGLVGPGLFTLTFAAAIGVDRSWHLPGASFLLAALMLAGALAVARAATRSGG